MAGNQQFCLRWNNHQRTLISVFDSLLESGTLVDCTLAAEGQYLRAHKVVLSACSPFFEVLFSQHYEKHPIIILKDVTFGDLKAMLDYMYRGEVNICQDQLGTFLKAAESLQIKGLTDNSGNGDLSKKHDPRRLLVPPPAAKSPCFPTGLVVEPSPLQKITNNNVDSPPRRKRRLSEESLGESVPAAALVATQCGTGGGGSGGGGGSVGSDSDRPVLPAGYDGYGVKSEMKNEMLAAAAAADDYGDDIGPYPDDDDEEEMDLSKPGTSNSHPPGGWNVSGDNTCEEPFTPGGSQEQEPKMVVTRPLVSSLKAGPPGAPSPVTPFLHPSGPSPGGGPAGSGRGSTAARSISCPTCHKFYSSQHTLRRHIRLECGKEPQFHCPYCPRRTKQRYNLMLHIARAHKPEHTQPLW